MPMSPIYFSRQQVATVNVSTDDLVIHRIDNFNQTTNIPRLVVSSPPSRPSRLPPPQPSSSPSTSYSPPVSSPTRHKEDWAADLALMNRIKGCRNWRDLLNLSSCTSMTDRSWNHVHCSAALTHLAKLSSPPKSTSSKQSGYNSIMDNHIIESWGEVEDLIARLCALLASRMSACKPRQVANSTWALAKIYTGLLKPYAELKRLNEDDSVQVLRVDGILLATMKALLIRSHRLMDKSHPSHIPPFNPQELSNLIYSVASLSSSGSAHGRSSEPLVILPDGWVERWIKAASHPQIKSNLSPQSMANIAWSFTQLAFPTSSSSSYPSPSSSSSYPSPSSYSSYPSPSFDPSSGPSWVERAQEWLSALCSDQTESEISSISSSAVGVEGGARTDRTNKRPPLSSHDTPSLAVLSWSLAKMDVMPSEAWLISFFNTTQARLAHMTARDLSNVAWAVSSWSRAAYRSSSSLWALSVSVKHPPSSPPSCKDARDKGGWRDEEGFRQGGDQSKSSIRSPPSLLPLPLSQTSVTYPSSLGSPEDGRQTESKWGDLISSRQRERNAAERRRKRLFRSSDSSPSSTTSTSSDVSMSEGEEEMTSSWNPSLARRFNRFSPNNSSSTQSEPTSINNTVSCSSLEDDLSPIPSSSVSSGSHEVEGMTSDVQLSRTTASLKEVFGYWKDELLSQFELRASGTLHLMSSPTSSTPLSGSKTSSRPLQLLSSRGSGSRSGQETSNNSSSSSSSYRLLVTPYDSRPDWWRLDPLSFSSLCSSLEALKHPLTQTLVRLPPRPPSSSPSPSPSSSLSLTSKDGGRNHHSSTIPRQPSHMRHQHQSNSSVINGRRSKRIERFQSSSPPDFTSSSSSSSSSPPYQPSTPWSSPAHRSTQGPIHEARPPISPPLISFASWLLEASLRNSAWVGSRGLVSVASLLSLSVAANAALGDQGDEEEGGRVEILLGEKRPVASKFIVEGRMHALIWAAAGARPRVRPPGSIRRRRRGGLSHQREGLSHQREGLSHQRAALGDPSSTTAPLESRLIPFEDSWAASRLLSVLTRLEAFPGHRDISPTGAHTALKLFRVSTSHMVLKASPAYTTSDRKPVSMSSSSLDGGLGGTSDRKPVSMARELDEAEVQTVVSSLMDAARLRLMISPHRLLTIFSSLATSLSHQARRSWMASLKGQEIELSRSIAVLVVRSVSKRSSLQSASACLLPHRSSYLKRRLQTLKELCEMALNLINQLQATSHLVDGSASNGRSSSSSVNKNQVAIIWSISALSGTLHRLNEKIQAAAEEKRMLGPSNSIISPIHKKGEDGERKRPPPSFVKTRFNQSFLIRRVSLRRGRGGFSSQPNLPPSLPLQGSSLGVTSPPLNLDGLKISMLGPEELGMLLSSLSYQHASVSSSQPLPSHLIDALMDRVRSLLPDLNDGLLATALNLFSNLMEGAIHVHREGRDFLMDGDERWGWTGFLDDVDVELGWRQSVEGGEKSLVACRRAREKMRGIVRH